MGKKNQHGKNARKGARSAKHKRSGKYVRAFVTTEKNRLRKRAKHVRLHPNDLPLENIEESNDMSLKHEA